ncbi:T9SS type A sorting domain-containing protein [uncultured Pontibacter sp.]|uniref:T9SS type A sorting domain-containing protein n=1 Tax=uncultured Pontibacter sp. TaxID=453356 RepID=UPI00261DED5D|nr:T9SS type A sorting domain-containing protein [uncultured Pontibacter sp.]
MIRFIFTLILVFTSTAFAFSQADNCVREEGCFRMEYLGAIENTDNTFTLTYTLQVDCATPLDYIAFELPEGSRAANPANIYARDPKYKVDNGITSGSKIQTDFNAIQFNAKPKFVINNGMVDTVRYYLTAEDFASMGDVRVQTKAGDNLSLVTFNLTACGMESTIPEPVCTLDLGEMEFGFVGADDNGDGTSTVWISVRNNTESDIQSVAFESTNAAVTLSAPMEGASYKSKYKYKTTAEGGTITFEAQNTNGYANMMQDMFGFVVPTAAYESEPFYLITATTNTTTVSTGFDTETCEDSPIVPLPVELISFTGKATQSGIELKWSTASEQNNDRFEIEHSADAKAFNKIGTVSGVGNTSLTQHYSFETEYMEKGVHYFRLRQIDTDGTFEFSKTIAVSVSQNPLTAAGMALYPNPTTGGEVTVALQNPATQQGAQVQIMHMNGRVVHTEQIAPGGIHTSISIPRLQLTKGMYMVTLRNGDTLETQKLLIQ